MLGSGESILQDDLRQGGLFGVGEGERGAPRAEAGGMLLDLAGEVDGGAAAGVAPHLDLFPGDAAPAGADGLHRGLLGGKAGGVALGAVLLGVAVADLGGSEDAVEETRAEARDGG